MSSVEQTVRELVRELCPDVDADLGRETPADEAGITSLDFVELVFALEERFDVKIPYNANMDGGDFGTIGQLIDAVEEMVEAKGS